jgi:hypothetical protein
MAKSHLPLNALRAFEASARHLSFTKAGMGCVSVRRPSAIRSMAWRHVLAFSCSAACRADWH